ncbi:hypothetical protein [Helicobacter suis]|uniref:hypothetical protein n=1 Tax=Helicobacter suis TaxID=104628 RepID=UPI000304A29D|nr:hypothetical protein [Helicobacter suis]
MALEFVALEFVALEFVALEFVAELLEFVPLLLLSWNWFFPYHIFKQEYFRPRDC